MSRTFMEQDLDAELAEMEEEEEDEDRDFVEDGPDGGGMQVDDKQEGDKEKDGPSDSDDDEEEQWKTPEGDVIDDSLDAATNKKIYELDKEIAENPYNYQSHLDLLAMLKEGCNLDKIREVRKRFSTIFPLTTELWLEWIEDEKKIATTEEERNDILTLFETAVEDYRCVDLWLEYCQYSIGGIGTEEGLQKARKVHENALEACGAHLHKGCLIWEAYRMFETVLLGTAGPEGGDKYRDQKNRIIDLYRRQGDKVLSGMEKTLEEYMEFAGNYTEQSIVKTYKANMKVLKMKNEFEAELDSTKNEDRLAAYHKYLDCEKADDNLERYVSLCERAVLELSLEPSLWIKYIDYLENHPKDLTPSAEHVILKVYSRAVRNVPWSGDIWCSYLIALEQYNADHTEFIGHFETALTSVQEPEDTLNLWLTFISYTVRRTTFRKELSDEQNESMSHLLNVFVRAETHLFGIGADPDGQIQKFLANVQAKGFMRLETARVTWNELFVRIPSRMCKAENWMDNINFEKRFGDVKHIRKRYERAMAKTWDDPEAIAKSWLQFEREEGNVKSFNACRNAIRLRMDEVERQREATRRRLEREKEREERAQQEMKKEKGKAKGGPDGAQSANRGQKKEPASSRDKDGFKIPSNTTGKKRPLEEDNEPPAKQAKKGDAPNKAETEEEKQRTVFLSNLDFKVTEKEIEELMSSSGTIEEVRLARHVGGKSRGFAFVSFRTLEEAQTALKRDKELLNGRPVYISECDPSKRKEFQYQTGMEKNKLFVKGLDLSVTKEELTDVFSKFGKVKDVRLVTYRNGNSKGIAFVDLEDEVSAATALIKADGLKIKDKVIEVAISNPPRKKDDGEAETAKPTTAAGTKSLGGTAIKDFGPRGKGRTQIAFMPRSLSVPAKPASANKLVPLKFVKPKAPENGETEAASGKDGAESNSNGTAAPAAENKPKSNSDFRQLLLGSK